MSAISIRKEASRRERSAATKTLVSMTIRDFTLWYYIQYHIQMQGLSAICNEDDYNASSCLPLDGDIIRQEAGGQQKIRPPLQGRVCCIRRRACVTVTATRWFERPNNRVKQHWTLQLSDPAGGGDVVKDHFTQLQHQPTVWSVQ